MKRTILAVLCALLLLPAMLCAVSAEETSDTTSQMVTHIPTATGPEQPTTTDPVTDGSTTAADPVTDGSDTATETEPTSTTTARVYRMGTSMSVAYDNHVITVRVTDENGQSVRSAPVTVAVDGTMYAVTTNQSGVATMTIATDPGEIVCLMEEFQGNLFLYEAARASVVLSTGVVTTPTQSVGTTTATATTEAPTSATEAPTKAPTRRPLGPTRTLTTTDPEDGDVTQVVVITEATTTAAPTEPVAQQPPKNSVVPKALIVGLIVGGAVLLVAAALLTYFFLIRKPRDEEEAEAPIEEDEIVSDEPIATVVDLETDLATPAAEKTAIETSAPKTTVRLEDLFKGE